MKKLGLVFLSLLFAVGTLTSAQPAHAAIDNSPDNDTVAIIRGGTFTESDLRNKAKRGDIPKVFSAFGISQGELNGFVDGVVYKDGRVTIGNDQVVARNAMTAGRWDNPKSGMTRIPNTDRAYKMSTRHFVDEGQTAFIKMVNGRFSFAIIKPCGNPVTATPVKPPTPGITIKKDVSLQSSTNWAQSVTVKPGDHVKYRVTIKNTGKTTLDKLSFQDIFPDGITQVTTGGVTTTINGKHISNSLHNGITLDPLKPGDQFVVIYEATTRPTETRPEACTTGLINKGTVRSGGVLPDRSDTAIVKVCAPSTPTPEYVCESLNSQIINRESRTVRFTARSNVAGGAVFDHYIYEFGDNTTSVETANNTVDHTYATEGNYTARVTVVVTVDGQEKSVTGDSCTTPISFIVPTPPTPDELVDTGPGAAIGAVISTVTAGSVAYKYVWLRRLV